MNDVSPKVTAAAFGTAAATLGWTLVAALSPGVFSDARHRIADRLDGDGGGPGSSGTSCATPTVVVVNRSYPRQSPSLHRGEGSPSSSCRRERVGGPGLRRH
jgi:hypothetical protein